MYDKLIDELKRTRTDETSGYHNSGRFFKTFLPYLTSFFDVFNGHDVVDIGSCGGALSAALAMHADSCIAVETQEVYHNQCKKLVNNLGLNVNPVNKTIAEFAQVCDDYQFNALYASNVLYHLKDSDVIALTTILLPKCDKVLMFSRENKPKKKNSYDLYKWQNIVSLLESAGFDAEPLVDVSTLSDVTGGTIKVTGGGFINRDAETRATASVLVPVLGTRKK